MVVLAEILEAAVSVALVFIFTIYDSLSRFQLVFGCIYRAGSDIR